MNLGHTCSTHAKTRACVSPPIYQPSYIVLGKSSPLRIKKATKINNKKKKNTPKTESLKEKRKTFAKFIKIRPCPYPLATPPTPHSLPTPTPLPPPVAPGAHVNVSERRYPRPERTCRNFPFLVEVMEKRGGGGGGILI